MNNNDLVLMLKGKVPIIALETYDEANALELLSSLGREVLSCAWKWSITDGLMPLGFGLELKKPQDYAKPEAVLHFIKQQQASELFVLCDLHPFLDDPKTVRYLKDIALSANEKHQKIVLLSHAVSVPAELRRMSAKARLRLPNAEEILTIVKEEARQWQEKNRGLRIRTDTATLEKLVSNMVGLPHQDIRRLAYGAIADDGAITEADLSTVTQAKFALMDMEGVLHFEYSTEHLKGIAGFENLKQWLRARTSMMLNSEALGHGGEGKIPTMDPPKGVMLFGVQGGGKSLAAKAIAGVWGLPLLRLDMAALYNKYIGETEKNLREALKLADLMSPCVLWIDEIEKGLAEDSDNAVGKRILGTLLTWMSERKSRVFLVATSNDISGLPPELLRKGRFDETFFVDLPEIVARQAIFDIHLSKRGLNTVDFELPHLAAIADGFTGAEIEQAIVSAMYVASADETKLNQEHLIESLTSTQPLSVLRAEHLHELRAWAEGRAARA